MKGKVRSSYALRLVFIFVAYVIAGLISLRIQALTGMGTQVWPAAGIALVGVLEWGSSIWPAFFLGTLTLHLLNGDSIQTFVGPAIGNTIEPLVGAYLCHRAPGFDRGLARTRSVVFFVLGAALAGSIAGAVIGVPYLALVGKIQFSHFYLMQYLAGDSLGILIVAPLLLVFRWPNPIKRFEWSTVSRLELSSFLVAFLGALLMFVGFDGFARAYFFFPVLLWSALRLGQRGATVVALLLIVFAVWETAVRLGPFGLVSHSVVSEFSLLMLAATLQLTGLLMAAIVTERESLLAQRELDHAKLEELLVLQRATLEATSDGILAVDREQRISGFNQSLLEIWGVSASELKGRHYREVLAAVSEQLLNPEECVATLDRVFASPASVSSDQIRFKTGRVLERRSKPQMIEGTYVGRVFSYRDITEQLQAQAALSRSVKLRDEFIALASHELRTPLTPLQLGLELLETVLAQEFQTLSSRKADVDKLLQMSRSQVARLCRLVENMLDTTRIGAGVLSLSPGEMSLSDLIRSVVERFEVALNMAGCQVTLFVESNVVGVWDRFRIEQVFVNLLSNVMKHAAGRPVEIRVTQDARFARVSVKDSGKGIAVEDQAHIFGRFERVDPVRNSDGLGLGLYISNQIMHAHGGRILLESKSGEGATFTIELPR